jgi:hypothetical protein
LNTVVRTWLGFAALGAGLIHLALFIGADLPVAVGLGLVGAFEIGWGIFAFTSEGIPRARSARAGALVPVALWAFGLVLQLDVVAHLAVFPMLAASALDLAVAIGITAVIRLSATPRPTTRERPADAEPAQRGPSRSRRPGAHFAAMFAGALVIAAVTVPALVAAGAGDFGGPPSPPATTETPSIGHGH